MSLFGAIDISGSGMSASRLWLDIIANNIANVNTTRGVNNEPYRRRLPIFSEALKEANTDLSFDDLVEGSYDQGEGFGVNELLSKGVMASRIADDPTAFKMAYEPGHPDADAKGYVKMPNVNIVNEMVNMIAANRAYDASIQVTNAAKTMMNKALEIGK